MLSLHMAAHLSYQLQCDLECPHAFLLTVVNVVSPPASEGLAIVWTKIDASDDLVGLFVVKYFAVWLLANF